MDALNLRVLVNLSGGSGEGLKGMLAMIAASPAPTAWWCSRTSISPIVDVPGYGRRAAARLEADVAAGARGLKIFKNLGLSVKRANGARVPLDDAELDPVWAACARLEVPVLIHTGEPAPSSSRWM